MATTTTISLSDTVLKSGETATVTITFPQPVPTLAHNALSAPNGTLKDLESADGGLTWTALFTPQEGISAANNVVMLDNAVTGGAGSTQSAAFSIDTIAPSVTIEMSDTNLVRGETATVTISFSEAMLGMDGSKVGASNGSLSSFTTSNDGLTWTSVFTPAEGVSSFPNWISLDTSTITDLAGNGVVNTVNHGYYSVDTISPLPLGATIGIDDNMLDGDDSAGVTITFSEAVSGFDSGDLTVGSGTVTGLSSNDEGLTWQGTLKPSAGVESTGNVISLDLAGVMSIASGLAGTGTATSAQYVVDTKAPTATVALSDSALKAGETAQLTIVFSERVTGLTVADLTVANGSLGDLASSDGGLTWTATFTPAADVTDATNVITLDKSGVLDMAGNAGLGTVDSANYAIDTQRPSATIALSDNALGAGETAQLTIVFSERVTGLDAADLAVANGSLGTLSSSDEGLTWSATFTPAAEVSDATNVITLDTAGVLDLAGNAGAGMIVSGNYTIDTVVPPAPVPAPVPVIQVDGVGILKETGIGAGGFLTQVITIPTVTSSRIDSGGTAALADIPLLTGADGRVLLELGVPVGLGLQASGGSTARAAGQSVSDLIAAIQSRTTAGSQEQQSMVSGGSGFLGMLDASAPLLVHTIVAGTPADASGTGGALVIRGAAPGNGTPHTALVIDGGALPAGSVIELQNVAFAAVVGNVRLTGGEGSQTIVGDGASQYIVLGDDDDVLHGGAGNDIVGSGAGKDQIFGDDGDDIVFGGLDDDIIDGGAGHDIVQLAGAGRDDYILRVSGGKLVMTHRDGGVDGTDIVSNVEVLRFTGGAADLDFRDTDVASLVRLYDTAFGRNPDEAGINFWIARSEAGDSLHDIALAMMASAEAQQQYASMSNEAYIRSLYIAGLDRAGRADEVHWWASRLDSGAISRGDALLGFADSTEKVALVGVIDTSIEVF